MESLKICVNQTCKCYSKISIDYYRLSMVLLLAIDKIHLTLLLTYIKYVAANRKNRISIIKK